MTHSDDTTAASRAIETVYNGYRFRSRLEARWAVFFDALNVAYDYEPQGFELGKKPGALRYLPDFWLPREKLWIEIKPSRESVTPVDIVKLIGLSEHGDVLCIVGRPWHAEYFGTLFRNGRTDARPCFLLCSCGALVWADPMRQVWGRFEGCCALGVAAVQAEGGERIQRAYEIARGSRFEHGEHPETDRGHDGGKCRAGFKLHRRGRRIPPDAFMCAECGEIEYDLVENFEGCP